MKLLFIIPCYNEENRLPVIEFLNYAKVNKSVSFLFVNDGSKDNTLSLLEEMANIDNINYLDLKKMAEKQKQ